MNPQDAIDFSREAIKTCMMIGGPILAASLLIGLLVGVFQAMTQVQDQTVSFVPKFLLLLVTIGLCLPWLTDQMLEFAKHSFEKPMTQWAGTSQPNLFPSSNNQSAQPVAFTTPTQKTADQTPNGETPRTTSPFILPHYRISKAPKSDIGS